MKLQNCLRSLAVVAALGSASAGLAQAPYTFRFANANGQFTDNFEIPYVGGTVEVRVYLQEGSSTAFLATVGLSTFGVGLNYDPNGKFSIPSETDIVSGPDFDADWNFAEVSSGYALDAGLSPGDPIIKQGGSIHLATFTLTGTAPGYAIVLTSDGNPEFSFADTLLGNGTVIDSQIANRTALINVLSQPVNRWAVDADGQFSVGSNWLYGNSPAGNAGTANFLSTITAPRTVTVAAPASIRNINFEGAQRYTLSGPGTLTLTDAGKIDLGGGVHAITAPLSLTGAATIADGTLLSHDVVGGGSLKVQSDAVLSASSLKLSQGSLTIGAGSVVGGEVRIAASTPSGAPQGVDGNVLVVKTLDIARAGDTFYGKLDLADNDMIVTGAGLTTAARNAQYQQIVSAVSSGQFSGPLWQGTGIASSVAGDVGRPQVFSYFGLGVVYNDADSNPLTPNRPGETKRFDSFDGVVLSGGETLVKFTYQGDANLNGMVDDGDYLAIDAGLLGFGAGWAYGDFNANGSIDDGDYGRIDAGRSAFEGFGTVAVPEPASAWLLLAGSAALGAAIRRGQRLR